MLNDFKPYLIRALYDWCSDNSLTSYIQVYVNEFTQVPSRYIVDGKILLNISSTASRDLVIDNKFISFYARFSGVEEKILIPIGHIISFYAKENGQGMNFELEVYNSNSVKKDDFDEVVSSLREEGVKGDRKNYLKIVKNNLS